MHSTSIEVLEEMIRRIQLAVDGKLPLNELMDWLDAQYDEHIEGLTPPIDEAWMLISNVRGEMSWYQPEAWIREREPGLWDEADALAYLSRVLEDPGTA